MNKLKEIRTERNISGVEIAEYLNISPQFYYALEKGTRTLTQEYLEKLSDFYNVPTDYLLGRDESSYKNNEIDEYLDALHKRPELKILFSKTKKATKEDIEKVVKMIDVFRGE